MQQYENQQQNVSENRTINHQESSGKTLPSVPVIKKENHTGLPDNLKNGIESMSGFSMDDVKVHYNSDKPAQLQAFAYAQGSEIHLGPGQEKHISHEAWHVVQQKQGRVQPTIQMKQGFAVNDDIGLEHEAGIMGEKAISALPLPTSEGLTSEPLPVQGITQRMAVNPALGDGTQLQYEQDINVQDDQAPIRIAEYRYTDPVEVATRALALTRISELYAEIGSSLYDNNSFLSRGKLKDFAYGNANNAPIIYSILQNEAKVPANAPGTNQQKQNEYRPYLQNPIPRERLRLFQNQETLTTLKDPLQAIVTVPYTGSSLTATINFTEALRGYITGIHEVQNNVDTVNATLERRNPYRQAIDTQTTAINTFSGTHHMSGNRTAQQEIDMASPNHTHYEQERGVDAMTKVIAEGGRFLCVRDLGLNLRNTTRFYVETESPDGNTIFPYVAFSELYRMWADQFQSRYNIPNKDVAEYLHDNALRLPQMDYIELEAQAANAVSVDPQ